MTHEGRHLPNIFTGPSIRTQNIAISAPITERMMNPPLFIPPFHVAAPPLPAFVFNAFILILLKLDILTNARFTNAFSEADAGVVGIDSTKDHRAEVNRFPAPLPPSSFMF